MGKVVATEFISLDGVIEDPGGSEDFANGGWTFEIDRGAEGDQFKLGELEESEAQLLGRVTYEGFAAAWPSREGDADMGGFAEKMNSMPKYVYSNSLESAGWENTTVLSGDFAAAIGRAKEEIDGVILVAGKHLFADDGHKVPLALADARTIGDGIQLMTYERTAA